MHTLAVHIFSSLNASLCFCKQCVYNNYLSYMLFLQLVYALHCFQLKNIFRISMKQKLYTVLEKQTRKIVITIAVTTTNYETKILVSSSFYSHSNCLWYRTYCQRDTCTNCQSLSFSTI